MHGTPTHPLHTHSPAAGQTHNVPVLTTPPHTDRREGTLRESTWTPWTLLLLYLANRLVTVQELLFPPAEKAFPLLILSRTEGVALESSVT